MLQTISLILMSSFYIFAGVMHFRNPKPFLKITPPWVPAPKRVNLLVGAIEIILGIGLWIPTLQSYAAMGIIALLVAVFPANIFHHQLAKKEGKLVLATIIRLPVQGLLIWWAYTFI